MQVEVPLIRSVSKDVEVNITFNSIKGTDLDFSYSLPTGLGLVAKGVKAFFGKQIEKTQLLKWGEGENQVILFIDKLLEKLQVEGVDLNHQGDSSLRHTSVGRRVANHGFLGL